MAHVPVLLNEVISFLQPRSGARYMDVTVGGGGHAAALLRASQPDGRLLGTDADAGAIATAAAALSEFGARVVLRPAWLDEAPRVAREMGFAPLDGILADLGLSSNQLDDAERGLSFMRAGALDMRFDRSRRPTAAELVNELDVAELARLLREYGEVQSARRVAEAVWAARPLRTTADLREVVLGVCRHTPGHSHPATQVFQALRIAVNDELRRLADGLPRLIEALAPGGRLAVISFHSLEDRIVKQTFRLEASSIDVQPGFGVAGSGRSARVHMVTRKPVEPAAGEVLANPRARSARLRVVERIDAEVV